ncbi:MAG: hypothetical protein ACRET4_04430, partial [Steroidobacteraceae bacterium]
PVRATSEAGRTIRSVLEPAYRDERMAAARLAARRSYAIPPSVVAALRGQSVDADPWDIAAVWAYDLRWNPVPVFQSYSAYTSYLDHLNADYLRGHGAPTGVLRHLNTALDNRLPAWESPESMVVLTCEYAVKSRARGWEALRRAGNACGRAVPLGERHLLHPGETLRVPPARDPTSIVAATFAQPTSSVDRLFGLGLKPAHLPSVLTNGRSHRFISATADALHLLSVPAAIGTRRPTNGGMDIRSLGFTGTDGAVAVRFYEIPTRASRTVIPSSPG